jgi:hypothetical protein
MRMRFDHQVVCPSSIAVKTYSLTAHFVFIDLVLIPK